MWPFKKKEEPSLSDKIEKAILKKKRQMVAMYLVGILGGSAWCYTYIEGRQIFADLTKGEKVMVFENTRVIEVAKAQEPEAEKEWKTAEFSSYTASVDETDASPLVMASGKMVYIGAIACPRSLELGTKVEVRGLGVFTCEDRMNERYENHFDIFKMTKQEAKAFGRKNLEWREA